MFGLFDPPAVKIRKRLPRFAHREYDQFVQLAQGVVPTDFDKSRAELLVGFVAAAWVASENREGRLPLGALTGEFIQKTLAKCHDRLGTQGQVALDIFEQLRKEGHVTLRK